MEKPKDPRELAVAMMSRSICNVQVGAVLVDRWGIFSWGHNHCGNGFGQHAEAHCLSRANWKRLSGATIYVAAQRKRNKKPVTARPCSDCERIIRAVDRVVFRDSRGVWVG